MCNYVRQRPVESSGYFMRGGVEADYDDMAKDPGVLCFAPVRLPGGRCFPHAAGGFGCAACRTGG